MTVLLVLLPLCLGMVIGWVLWGRWNVYASPTPVEPVDMLRCAQAIRDIDAVANEAVASMRAVVSDHLRRGRPRRS